MTNEIHPTAVIAPGARLGSNNRVGAFSVLEDDVVIGDGNHLQAHCVLRSGLRLGNENQIHEHAVLGGPPQDLKFKGVPSYVQIGNRNVFREGVTVHRGTHAESSTIVGDDIHLMAYSHVAHNCHLGNGVILANNVALAGDVEIQDRAFISGGVVIHQFTRIGKLAMIGGNSKIVQDALPFFVTDGVPARARGLNRVGLKRAGFNAGEVGALKQAYHLLLKEGLRLSQALPKLRESDSPHVLYLAEFASRSGRGFHRERGKR